MNPNAKSLCFYCWRVSLIFSLLQHHSFALNSDGVLLLSFKYTILSDPLSVLQNWNYNDETPCSWSGVACTEMGNPGTPDMFRVTSLVLPNNQLLGSISEDLGKLEHLQKLDLSNNFFNGSLPITIFNASELQVLSLSNNVISGELSEFIGALKSLKLLNLSDNALAGKVPKNLTYLQNLTVISLRSNYFSGSVLSGFDRVEVLDLSSNLLNGSLPLDFGGDNLSFLNLSYNKISGKIPQEFAEQVPKNATIDISFNNLTGSIPESLALINQKTEMFSGNDNLCGKPLKNLCSIPSTLSIPPNVSTTPAIAAIPKTIDSNQGTNSNGAQKQAQSNLKPGTIAGIVVGDLAGVAILAMIILHVYHRKKRSVNQPSNKATEQTEQKKPQMGSKQDPEEAPKQSAWSCLTMKGSREETSEEATNSSDSDPDEKNGQKITGNQQEGQKSQDFHQTGGVLVMMDGDLELEVDTLLKASAYILGASGASIVYKALLEDGTALVVRRIGESRFLKMKEFENHVRLMAKLRHPNLVRVCGFYWGDDEKLIIYEYVSNGNLANTSLRKPGLSPSHLPLEVRFKIVNGIARALAYIHEKKHVHGNIKPSNILLTTDMEPKISDLGLDRFVLDNTSHKASGSGRFSNSFKSMSTSRGGDIQHNLPHVTCSPSTSSSSIVGPLYKAPESLKNVKPNPKWDVFSFGVVLLEIFTGRLFSEPENQGTSGLMLEEKNQVLRMVDVAIKGEVESREEVVMAYLKLGFSCVSFVPQKRPTMKEALQVLEKVSFSTALH